MVSNHNSFSVMIFAITGMALTEILNRMESRFDKWRPKVGAAA